MARCPVCWSQTADETCGNCGATLDPELLPITAPISPDDLAALHDAHKCDPNCDLCAAEAVG